MWSFVEMITVMFTPNVDSELLQNKAKRHFIIFVSNVLYHVIDTIPLLIEHTL